MADVLITISSRRQIAVISGLNDRGRHWLLNNMKTTGGNVTIAAEHVKDIELELKRDRIEADVR